MQTSAPSLPKSPPPPRRDAKRNPKGVVWTAKGFAAPKAVHSGNSDVKTRPAKPRKNAAKSASFLAASLAIGRHLERNTATVPPKPKLVRQLSEEQQRPTRVAVQAVSTIPESDTHTQSLGAHAQASSDTAGIPIPPPLPGHKGTIVAPPPPPLSLAPVEEDEEGQGLVARLFASPPRVPPRRAVSGSRSDSVRSSRRRRRHEDDKRTSLRPVQHGAIETSRVYQALAPRIAALEQRTAGDAKVQAKHILALTTYIKALRRQHESLRSLTDLLTVRLETLEQGRQQQDERIRALQDEIKKQAKQPQQPLPTSAIVAAAVSPNAPWLAHAGGRARSMSAVTGMSSPRLNVGLLPPLRTPLPGIPQ